MGSETDSCRGAQNAIVPNNSIDPFFVRHCFSSRPDRREGRIDFTSYPDNLAIITLAASCVASRTSGMESSNDDRRRGSNSIMYGSKFRSSVEESVSTAIMAPCRGSYRFLSSSAT